MNVMSKKRVYESNLMENYLKWEQSHRKNVLKFYVLSLNVNLSRSILLKPLYVQNMHKKSIKLSVFFELFLLSFYFE